MANHGSYSTKTLKIHPSPPRQKLDIQNRFAINAFLESGPGANQIIKMLHGYMWSLILTCSYIFCMFTGGNSRLCTTFAQNADIFAQNFKPETLLEVPQIRETGFLAPLPASEAPGHRSSWRPPQPLWTAEALQPPRGLCMPPGGAASNLRRFLREAVGRRGFGGWAKRPTSRKRRKLWAAEFHRFNRLFRTQHLQNCSKQNIFTNKMNKLQYMFLINDTAFDEGKCNNLFFNHWKGL